MKATWRTLLWEYGAASVLVAFVLSPVIHMTEPPNPIWWIAATVCMVAFLVCMAWVAITHKYPNRGDLPEWKEYEYKRDVYWEYQNRNRELAIAAEDVRQHFEWEDSE